MTPCLHSRAGLARVAPCPQCGERKPESASEIKAARTCWRFWAFKYASQTPRQPESDAQKNGTQLHTLKARYLTDGTRPDTAEWMGELACAGIDSGLLPTVGSGEVERPHGMVIGGIPFVVIRDWWGPYEAIPSPIDDLDGTVAVVDHKTSSNPRKYGLWSRESWLDDPAVLLYGTYEGDGAEVYYRWPYYPTKGRSKVIASDMILTRREIRGGLERVVLPVAERAYRLREQEIDPNSLEANEDSCTLFNRPCEYTDVCTVNRTAAYMRGMIERTDEDMTMPNLFASLPPVNGAPAAPAPAMPAPAAPAQTPFKFEFPAAPSVPAPAVVIAPAPAPAPAAPAAPPLAPSAPAPSAPAFEVTLRWDRGKQAEYDYAFSAKSTGRGATLDDAIKAAIAALPR